jgi:hypothetical protein
MGGPWAYIRKRTGEPKRSHVFSDELRVEITRARGWGRQVTPPALFISTLFCTRLLSTRRPLRYEASLLSALVPAGRRRARARAEGAWGGQRYRGRSRGLDGSSRRRCRRRQGSVSCGTSSGCSRTRPPASAARRTTTTSCSGTPSSSGNHALLLLFRFWGRDLVIL